MRVNGRNLRYSNLVERRFMLGQLGVDVIRVPRSENPYAVARRIRRMLREDDDATFVQSLLRRARKPLELPSAEAEQEQARAV